MHSLLHALQETPSLLRVEPDGHELRHCPLKRTYVPRQEVQVVAVVTQVLQEESQSIQLLPSCTDTLAGHVAKQAPL